MDRLSVDRRSIDRPSEHGYEEETRSVNIENKQMDERDEEEEKRKKEEEKKKAEEKKKVKKYIPIEAPLCEKDSPKMIGVREEISEKDLKRATAQEKIIAETMLTVRLRMNRFANTGFPFGTFGSAETRPRNTTENSTTRTRVYKEKGECTWPSKGI